LVALLTKEIFSETPPVTWGLNVIAKYALWPAASVIGKEMPFTEKGAVTVGGEMVTLPPVAVRVPL
jgi:hypothetical protein